MPRRQARDGVERIERAAVHVAGLRADDGRCDRATEAARHIGHSTGKRIRPHPTLVIGRDAHDLPRSDPQHPQRADDRHVHFVADDDADRRRALKAVRLDVPSLAAQQFMPCRRERGEVRHVAAGDETDAAGGRHPQQIDQPRARHFLDHRGGRGEDVEAGGLIPYGREPFSRDRRRQGAAGHEPEVARAGRGHEPGLRGARERVDDVGGIDRASGKRTAKRRAQFLQRAARPHGTVRAGRDVAAGDR